LSANFRQGKAGIAHQSLFVP